MGARAVGEEPGHEDSQLGARLADVIKLGVGPTAVNGPWNNDFRLPPDESYEGKPDHIDEGVYYSGGFHVD